MIEITASDGHVFSAYRADPAGTAKGVVIVLQEIFGANRHIRKVTDAFAAAGFIAVAPCLFDRVQKGVELEYDAAATAQGLELVKKTGSDQPMLDIQATVDACAGQGKVGLVGYDWGAYLAYHAANRVRNVVTVVGHYGCGIVGNPAPRRKLATLLHFGNQDAYIPHPQLVIFRASRPDLRILEYSAGHHFNCDERDTYDAAAAEAAWTETMLHLTHYLEGPPVITLKNQGSYASSGGKEKKKKPAVAVEDDLGPPL